MTFRLDLPAVLAAVAGSALAAAAAAQPAPAASAPPAAAPVEMPASLQACAQLRVDAERLLCYDKVVAPSTRGGAESLPASAGAPPSAAVQAVADPKPTLSRNGVFLDEFWELSPERKRGIFNFTGYRPNYFFPIHATSRINRTPQSPAAGHSGQLPGYDRAEAKLQISIRTKLAEDIGLPGGDVWFGYTQQSLWQLYNAEDSRPFRATDHEPELFYIVPARVELPLGFRTQMVGIGLAHQSNGQTLPFSRSWNRWYVLGGIENGNVALTGRYNTRIHESDDRDDNPDLTRYRGRAELVGVWTPGFATLSAQWRSNFGTRRGSLQLDATVPVSRKDPKGLRWYLQAFTGYAETLIDYNFRQTSVGAGVTLFGW